MRVATPRAANPMSHRAEVLSAAVWAAVGSGIVVASWRMERLESLGINPWSAPGLTPGIVGALIIVFALVLLWQALRAAEGPDHERAGSADATPTAGSARRTLAAAVLCVLFAGVSLGRGLPFAIEGTLFVFVFSAAFSWSTWRAEKRIGRGLAQTLAVAVIACAFIAWLFESVFLVRLP